MRGPTPPEAPLIEARNVARHFAGAGAGLFARRRTTRAVDGVSLAIAPGETLALVGESGSGKSTIGRLLLGLDRPDAGAVLYEGHDVATLGRDAARRFRREVQVVFQDSGASLNPRRSIASSIGIPLRHNLGLAGGVLRARIDALLERVALDPAQFRNRLPHELSGGQRQRVGIARAIASDPRLIVADEPVSALDVSVRAQILRLMRDLQHQDRMSCLFITHDLGVVRAVADRVAVMSKGRIVEDGPMHAVMTRPRHAYTRTLLAAVPGATRRVNDP